MKSATIKEFLELFGNDATCLQYLFDARFGQGHVCPKCQRKARWAKLTSERAYSCQWCGWHIHPTAGTIFEDTRTPLSMWFYAIYLFTTTRHGVSAKELQRQLGVTYKTAWRMGHKIREHMANVGKGGGKLSGTIEIDEAFIGRKSKTRDPREGKATLLGIVERGGDIVTQVIPHTQRGFINQAVSRNVERGSVLNTDTAMYYNDLSNLGHRHLTVNHKAGEYARGDVHVNSVEGFWAILKRGIRGTHIWVSAKHVESYAGEFAYRYNRRNKPEVMIGELLSSF